MALSGECEKHGWSWDPADDMGCPVCHGIAEESERIIKLLEDEFLSDDETAWQTRDWQEVERQQDQDWIIKEAIALIKGENK